MSNQARFVKTCDHKYLIAPDGVNYYQHIHSIAWRQKGEELARRSGGVCERCRIRPATDVHHRTYVNLGKELLGDLLHLCRRCHNLIHRPPKAANDDGQGDLFKSA